MAQAKTIETVLGEAELGRTSAETREVLRRYHDAFRNHAPEALVDLVADDCVIENISGAPNGSRHVGKAACLEVWQGIAAAKDKRFDHEEIFVAGDRIVTRWRLWWGNDESQSLRGLNLMRVRNGRIVEAFGYAKR
jgi:ketosteroid isomerase-like protein